jgi:hypothetical protein
MTRTRLHSSIAARTGEPLSVIRQIGFSLLTNNRDEPKPEDIILVLHCPFCGEQVPDPGRTGDGSNALAECPDCDVYFEFEDGEVFPARSRHDRAPVLARSRHLPA